MSNFEDYFKPIVMVTGFGPFENHPVNASWEAVKFMNKEEIENTHNVELVLLEIPVTYENVDEFVPALWETHTPKLMIHVGVSSAAQCLTLERGAHEGGYSRPDYFGKCPLEQRCAAAAATPRGDRRPHVATALDVERLCREHNATAPPDLRAAVSDDAGRYLCEYIYYTSLVVDASRTLFVHVPETRVCPAERTSVGLTALLALALDQLDSGDETRTDQR